MAPSASNDSWGNEEIETRTVLVVDDDDVFATLAEETVRSLSSTLEVLRATDGKAAVELLEQQPIDLLITDVQMPVMDGFQLLGYIANRRFGLPVLVVSGRTSPEDQRRLRQYGMDFYLAKPVDLGLLRDMVSQLLFENRGHLRGFTVASVLQLIELEQKTCQVLVRSAGQLGELDFDGGRLVHATDGANVGDAAALAMFQWPYPEVEIQGSVSEVAPTIRSSVMHLLLESARLADEDGAADSLARSSGSFDRMDVASILAESPELSDVESRLLDSLAAIRGVLGVALVDVEGEFLGAAPSDQPLRPLTAEVSRLLAAAADIATTLDSSSASEEIFVGFLDRSVLIYSVPPDRHLVLVLERATSTPALIKYQVRTALVLALSSP